MRRIGFRPSWFLFLLAGWSGVSLADAPEWLLNLRHLSLPEYPVDTEAIVLYDEGRTSVTRDGEIRSSFRLAYKILTPAGLDLAWRRLTFDGETRISGLKAWNLKSGGIVHEVTQKDAVESQMFSGVFFSDNKSLLLTAPQVEVDSIVGFQWERRHRPYILQDFWWFQGTYPVLRSRFILDLPDNWRFDSLMRNHAEIAPRASEGNRWMWELKDLPGIPQETDMPPIPTLAAQLAVSYFPVKEMKKGQSFESWNDVAGWFGGLMAPRATPTPDILRVAREIGSEEAIAAYVQQQIRYVAVEIGIGGYQPHQAAEIFRNKYGDCKDKVTLLRTLSRGIGQEVYPVLIHTRQGVVDADFPSPLSFNHVIAAIPAGEGGVSGQAILDHSELGRLLLFDPTDSRTPFGQLPDALQGTTGLLVVAGTGHVIQTPIAPSIRNRSMRDGVFQLSGEGVLAGDVRELYWGVPARRERSYFQGKAHDRWMRFIEHYLAHWMPGVRVGGLSLGNTSGTAEPFFEEFRVTAPYFAQRRGELMLFRPCVIGTTARQHPSRKERQHPLVFDHLSLKSDIFKVTLPPGYVVEELPEPVELDLPFIRYKNAVTVDGRVLKTIRTLEVKQLKVAAEDVETLREFYRAVDRDERNMVLLKREEPTSE